MNLHDLKSHLKHLLRLQEIKSDDEDENDLASVLVALLWAYLDTRDAEIFRLRFMWTLRDYYQTLDPSGKYEYIIERELAEERGWFANFLRDIRNGKLSEKQMAARAKSYARSLGKVKERITLEQYLVGGNDPLLKWVMGRNENHCRTCPSLHLIVRRASAWRLDGLYPKCSLTECDGSCLCHWEVVEE